MPRFITYRAPLIFYRINRLSASRMPWPIEQSCDIVVRHVLAPATIVLPTSDTKRVPWRATRRAVRSLPPAGMQEGTGALKAAALLGFRQREISKFV